VGAHGEGTVKRAHFFEIIKASKFPGPLQMHYEYAGLGGAEKSGTKLGISKDQLKSIMRRNLNFIKEQMKKVGLATTV